jgi:hypothetical protein
MAPSPHAPAVGLDGFDEYTIMTRVGDDPWQPLGLNREGSYRTLDGITTVLNRVVAQHADEMDAFAKLAADPDVDEEWKAHRVARLNELRATEHRIFHRHVPGFTPLP